MASSPIQQIFITAVVPNQSRREQKLWKAKARSHAAKVSHKTSRARFRAGCKGRSAVRFVHAGRRSRQSTRSPPELATSAIEARISTSTSRGSPRKPASAVDVSSHPSPNPNTSLHGSRLGNPASVDLNIYPIEKTEAVQTAMQYYTQVYARSVSFQLGSQKEAASRLQMLFPCLVQDVLWFSATVALSLFLRRRGISGPDSTTASSLEYYRKAMGELRRRISTEDDAIRTADGVLMAIPMLISIAMLQSDLKAAASHVNGLVHLVVLRGGEASLSSFDGYLRERVFGHFIMWDLAQAALKIDPGAAVYPQHPFSPYLCRHIAKLPSGLEELALSGSINSAIIRLLAGIVFYTFKVLRSTERSPHDVRKMLVFVYALSRQARSVKLNTVEQILIMALVEICVSLGSTRDLHWVIISYQQSRISSLFSARSVGDVLKDLKEYQDAFMWMGAVLVATGNADSDSWRLGKALVDGHYKGMSWQEKIAICERHVWSDELSIRLAQSLSR